MMERRFFIFLKKGLPSIWKEDHQNFRERKVTSTLFYKVTSTMHIRKTQLQGRKKSCCPQKNIWKLPYKKKLTSWEEEEGLLIIQTFKEDQARALTRFCYLHILCDPKQRIYKPCDYVIKTVQTGPITCGKPILKSSIPVLCTVHLQKAQKYLHRAGKKVKF